MLKRKEKVNETVFCLKGNLSLKQSCPKREPQQKIRLETHVPAEMEKYINYQPESHGDSIRFDI